MGLGKLSRPKSATGEVSVAGMASNLSNAFVHFVPNFKRYASSILESSVFRKPFCRGVRFIPKVLCHEKITDREWGGTRESGQ